MSAPTPSVLERLGFGRDDSVISDASLGYSYDFGNLTLEASRPLSPRTFTPVYMLGGVYSDGRTIAWIHSEMPLELESFEQGVAWAAFVIDQTFRLAKPPQWLKQGRIWKDHLTWVRRQAAYEARPQCVVRRDWLKIACKDLRLWAEEAGPSDAAVFSFDGNILSVTAAEMAPIAMPATGAAWGKSFAVRREDLAHLPRRIMRDLVSVGVWDGRLSIGRLALRLADANEVGDGA